MTNNLTMRWIPVADASGRTRLESVWVPLSEAGASGLAALPARQESATSPGTHAA